MYSASRESLRRRNRQKISDALSGVAGCLVWVGGVLVILLLVGLFILACKYMYVIFNDEESMKEFVEGVVWTAMVALATLFFQQTISDDD